MDAEHALDAYGPLACSHGLGIKRRYHLREFPPGYDTVHLGKKRAIRRSIRKRELNRTLHELKRIIHGLERLKRQPISIITTKMKRGRQSKLPTEKKRP